MAGEALHAAPEPSGRQCARGLSPPPSPAFAEAREQQRPQHGGSLLPASDGAPPQAAVPGLREYSAVELPLNRLRKNPNTNGGYALVTMWGKLAIKIALGALVTRVPPQKVPTAERLDTAWACQANELALLTRLQAEWGPGDGRGIVKLRGTARFTGEAGALREGQETTILLYEKYEANMTNLAIDLLEEIQPLDRCVTFANAVRALLDVAWGLALLHALRIVHRDIKPANLLWRVKRAGEERWLVGAVCDLGLARRLPEGQDSMPSAGGTRAYYAPEQETDEPTVSCQSDVYSLGLSMGEILTAGDAKWQAERGKMQQLAARFLRDLRQQKCGARHVTVMAKLVHAGWEDTESAGHAVGALIELVFRMLAVDPAQRPTAAGVRDELQQVCLGMGITRV